MMNRKIYGEYIDTTWDSYYIEDTKDNMLSNSDLIEIKFNNKKRNKPIIIDKPLFIKSRKPNKSFNDIIAMINTKNYDKIREILEIDRSIVNIIDDDSLLHLSVFSNDYEICKLFLKYGANPNIKDKSGQTPIFRIIFSTTNKILGLLIEYGALINMSDCNGNTPLHIAVLSKNYFVIKTLLEYGCDTKIKNNGNFYAIDYATTKKNGLVVPDEPIITLFYQF